MPDSRLPPLSLVLCRARRIPEGIYVSKTYHVIRNPADLTLGMIAALPDKCKHLNRPHCPFGGNVMALDLIDPSDR